MNISKRFSFVLLLLIATSSAVAAQELVTREGDFTAGGGFSFGTNVSYTGGSESGITLQGYYGITDEIRAGAGFTFYLIGEDNISASEFNIDGHYIFTNEDGLVLYGLAGLNFSRVSVDTGGFGSISVSDTGLNLGGGVEYSLGEVFLFGEPKLTVGGFDQFNLTGGIRLRF